MTEIKSSKWKAAPSADFELPSGNRVRVRRPSILSMMRRGVIPMRLITIAAGMAEGKKSVSELKPEETLGYVEFLTLYVCEASVEPKIVMKDPKGDQVGVDDLIDDDLQAIFEMAQGNDFGQEVEGTLPESFPEKSESDPDRSGSEALQSATESAPRDSESVGSP